ncbi:TetR/AcrR family transcriptional regulator [Glycomyces arizonensis]|uniref:TetR/AcrR family transcriptional regulator n=1 Tax=Glycomyces arizonensis TaxID=256035 RepID=UPI00055274A6|nr:TetR/AcrR family transcriptional regulator [Glycomyces arizonensis]
MEFRLHQAAPAKDRRVRRSRAALLDATVALVTEHGTAAVPLSEIAEVADVSRQLVYQHFGDRETLLLEAALDLAGAELIPRLEAIVGPDGTRERVLAVARHFAAHRVFYRALCNSSVAFAMNKALTAMLLPCNRQAVRRALGEDADAREVEDFSLFLTGGGAAFVSTWVVEGGDPLDPEEFTERFMRLVAAFDLSIRAAVPGRR